MSLGAHIIVFFLKVAYHASRIRPINALLALESTDLGSR
jgi:hypothetical protein